MPFKLIGTIILLILVTIFAGVNLDNKCDITFVFYTFKDIDTQLRFFFDSEREKLVKNGELRAKSEDGKIN